MVLQPPEICFFTMDIFAQIKSHHFGEQMPLTSSGSAFLKAKQQHQLHPGGRYLSLDWPDDTESFDLASTLTPFVEI